MPHAFVHDLGATPYILRSITSGGGVVKARDSRYHDADDPEIDEQDGDASSTSVGGESTSLDLAPGEKAQKASSQQEDEQDREPSTCSGVAINILSALAIGGLLASLIAIIATVMRSNQVAMGSLLFVAVVCGLLAASVVILAVYYCRRRRALRKSQPEVTVTVPAAVKKSVRLSSAVATPATAAAVQQGQAASSSGLFSQVPLFSRLFREKQRAVAMISPLAIVAEGRPEGEGATLNVTRPSAPAASVSRSTSFESASITTNTASLEETVVTSHANTDAGNAGPVRIINPVHGARALVFRQPKVAFSSTPGTASVVVPAPAVASEGSEEEPERIVAVEPEEPNLGGRGLVVSIRNNLARIMSPEPSPAAEPVAANTVISPLREATKAASFAQANAVPVARPAAGNNPLFAAAQAIASESTASKPKEVAATGTAGTAGVLNPLRGKAKFSPSISSSSANISTNDVLRRAMKSVPPPSVPLSSGAMPEAATNGPSASIVAAINRSQRSSRGDENADPASAEKEDAPRASSGRHLLFLNPASSVALRASMALPGDALRAVYFDQEHRETEEEQHHPVVPGGTVVTTSSISVGGGAPSGALSPVRPRKNYVPGSSPSAEFVPSFPLSTSPISATASKLPQQQRMSPRDEAGQSIKTA